MRFRSTQAAVVIIVTTVTIATTEKAAILPLSSPPLVEQPKMAKVVTENL
jgi:hypothetical protein